MSRARRIGESMVAATVLGTALSSSPDLQARDRESTHEEDRELKLTRQSVYTHFPEYEHRFKEIQELDPSRIETVTSSDFTVDGHAWLLDSTRLRFDDGFETIVSARRADLSPTEIWHDGTDQVLIVSHESPDRTIHICEVRQTVGSLHADPNPHFIEVSTVPAAHIPTASEYSKNLSSLSREQRMLDLGSGWSGTPEGMLSTLNSLYILTEGARSAGLEDATKELEARLEKLTSDPNYVIVERGEKE